jgi:membrane-associated phospholipid phosphatase
VSGHKGLIVNLMVSLVFTIYFWLLYGSSAVLSQLAPVVHRVDFAFEQAIPFVPWASLVYLTVMPFLALAPFVLKTPERLLPLVATLALQVLIAWWVYLIFPVQVSFPPHAVAGAVGALYSLAVALALVGNALPSLHVALSVSVAWCYAAGKTKLIRFACWGWALSISVSTVLTHQHNVLDVAAGAMLAFMTMGFVYPCLQDSLGGDLKRLFSREGVMVS